MAEIREERTKGSGMMRVKKRKNRDEGGYQEGRGRISE